MAYETKETWFIDETTITGSNDQLRNDIGNAWAYVEDIGPDTAQVAASALTGVLQYVPIQDLYSNMGIQQGIISTIASKSRCLSYIGSNMAYFRINQSSSILPNYIFPGRFYGAGEDIGGKIRTDEEWKTYLLGGDYGEESYPGIYSQNTFDIFGFQYKLPYSTSEAQKDNMTGVFSASIHYLYKQHLPEFDKFIRQIEDVRTLPNIELLKISTNRDLFKDAAYSYLTLDNTIDLETLVSTSYVSYIPPLQSDIDPTTNLYKDLTKNLRDYLIEFGRHADATSDEAQEMSTVTRNLFYNADALPLLREGSYNAALLDENNILHKYPYFVQLTWNPAVSFFYNQESHIRKAINELGFDSNLLYLLKKEFGSKGATTETKSFVLKQQQKTSGEEIEAVSSLTAKTKDFIELLLEGYTPRHKVGDCYFVQGLPTSDIIETQKAAKASPSDAHRFVNSYSSLNLLTYIATACDYKTDPTTPNVAISETDEASTNFQRLSHAPANLTDGFPGIYDYLKEAALSQYNETLAYRIEKKSGTTPIQDIWIYNDWMTQENGGSITYNDSQVVYDSEYAYTIYAYVLVAGFKHAMKDLRIGRNIGTGSTGAQAQYCIQFHNPSTNAIVDQLYFADEPDSDQPLSRYATDAQILSNEQYVADFNFYYEPSFKIFEIPIMTKNITVLDHPAGDLDVTPFQKIDNSQTLGFLIRAESFEPAATFPQTITLADKKYKSVYLTSNDLAEGAPLKGRSVTQQSAIEIFRMDTRPTNLTDFESNLYKTISLKIKDTQQYLSEYVFYDKVQTNKKYYYIMRFLNEKGSPGTLSPIIQAELIDDGGYKYSLFENIFEEDLVEERSTNPSTPFKKLMHILPTPAQLFLNTENIDFTQTAVSQLSNLKVGSTDNSLFDNTFKVRLTSKKTGKKIDLNLTFNLNEET